MSNTLIDKRASYFRYSEKHINNNFESLIEYLVSLKNLINEYDLFINQISIFISNFQAKTYSNSIQLSFENGYWRFFKVDSVQKKLLLTKLDKNNFYYTYTRLSISSLSHSLKDTSNLKKQNISSITIEALKNRSKLKNLFLATSKFIEYRNYLAKKISLSSSSIKRLKIKDELLFEVKKIFNTYK